MKRLLNEHQVKTDELRQQRSSLEHKLKSTTEAKANESDKLAKVHAELDSFSSMSDTDNERISHISGQISGISIEHKERQTEFFGIQEEISLDISKNLLLDPPLNPPA